MDSINLSIILATFVGVIGLTVALMSYILVRQQRERQELFQHLLERNHYGGYGEIREALEHQASLIEKRLVSNEKQFRDINHLIVDAQKEDISNNESASSKNYLKFTSTLGLSNKDYVIDKSLVFMLTPFREEEMDVYKVVIRAFQKFGIRVLRGDEENIIGEILPHIMKNILKARLIVANVDGRNPNVMYELGIAHALGKDVVIISSSLTPETDLPFDLRSRRVILYSNSKDLIEKLRDHVVAKYFTIEQDTS